MMMSESVFPAETGAGGYEALIPLQDQASAFAGASAPMQRSSMFFQKAFSNLHKKKFCTVLIYRVNGTENKLLIVSQASYRY